MSRGGETLIGLQPAPAAPVEDVQNDGEDQEEAELRQDVLRVSLQELPDDLAVGPPGDLHLSDQVDLLDGRREGPPQRLAVHGEEPHPGHPVGAGQLLKLSGDGGPLLGGPVL